MAAPIIVTMGEPAGIGGDIVLAAWAGSHADGLPPFAMVDDADRLEALAGRMGLEVPVARIDRPEETVTVFAKALPVLHRPLPVHVEPGHPEAACAAKVVGAIEEAVGLARSGRAAAVVTNPIHKKTLYDSRFPFPGHTEFLASMAGGVPVVMMLASERLRVVPVTVHQALRQAIGSLTVEAVVKAGDLTAQALARDFGIAKPRLAIAGVNPHAGEGGAMGDEDQRIVVPAVKALRDQGIDARGPLSADTMFHPAARAKYDAAVCMYHDQALIPIKALDFEEAVNVTLGLPFVRTSPDHGTALDIAGTGRARPQSLMAALRMAAAIAARRG